MGKRFGLRISWAIPSLNSCRSKDEDAAAAAAAPAAKEALLPAYLWEEEEKWHVVARVEPSPRQKIDSEDGGRELFPPLPLRRSRRRTAAKKKIKSKSKTKMRSRVSTSSANSHWFTSEDEKEYVEEYDYEDGETEVLMSSSRSFSTDDSSPPRERASSVLERLKMTPLLKLAGGKVKESFAVVKKSEDPYGDFRSSMAEMVVENQMYDEGDLEQLLHCFLVLNSRHHHPAIVRAFSDIWAAIFPNTAMPSCPTPQP
ncbi:unnamed protein product [Spirodela intermedia]|uniref:Transcription repressor n=1 Tax=Spirodela intermedia TaxID=51605 RepID=A0A7I8K9T5_SPIIN|nr:unnamed protein product [Spirodela intermedia]